MTVRRTNCYEQALACDLFDKLCNANSLKDILGNYEKLCGTCSLTPTNFNEFFPKIKAKIPSWRAAELWSKLDKRSAQAPYGRGKLCADTRVLIVGAGPCGIRQAIEAQFLGAKTVLIEKRGDFTRNNVLHLWPFTITDLKNLGAKMFYGKFCAGSIDHVSIRQLQCILLKIALFIGVEVHVGVSFNGLIEPSSESDLGWRPLISPDSSPVSHYTFDVLIGADGRRSTLPGFQRKALRAKLAIAITANFVNNHSEAEAKVPEISGVSYIFKQQFFQDLEEMMGIALENIVYYKDETHYFVMTPTKQSLLDKGVLYQDFANPEQLLRPENIDFEALQLFTLKVVVFATDNKLPMNLSFASNSRGEPDVAVFDFTTMYASENSCRAIERKGHKLLLGLVGDSLLEPFWPTGTGIARGFLAAYDAAYMIRSWGRGLKSVHEVLAERESLHRLLAQTTHENLNKDHNSYSIDPSSRYPNSNLSAVGPRQVKSLVDSGENGNNKDDIFISIRESRQRRSVPEDVVLQWFQDQLAEDSVDIDTLFDALDDGEALIGIIKRFRPDLIDASSIKRGPRYADKNNQVAFEILDEEYHIASEFDGQDLAGGGGCDEEKKRLLQYLSQVYNCFKGQIPKDSIKKEVQNWESRRLSYPDNSALHHSLSIKTFLEAKEKLTQQRKKESEEDAQSKRERRRSQLIETMESNYNQGRSTRKDNVVNVNIPVAKLKLSPVLHPGELFSLCRNGSVVEKSSQKPVTAGGGVDSTTSFVKLSRSKSDVGHTKMNGFCNAPPSSRRWQSPCELAEMQQRIRKQKATPLGNIVSTFLGKHINQNSGCLNNEEEERKEEKKESDENPLSNERSLLKPTRPRSVYQNLNDRFGNHHQQLPPPREEEDQEDSENENENVEQKPNNAYIHRPFLTPSQAEADPEFKEKCKFLEKSLYNSGRDIKVHLGSAWFEKAENQKKKKEISSSSSSIPLPGGCKPGPKSQSATACLPSGFHPLKRGSSFNVRSKLEEEEEAVESFNNNNGRKVVGWDKAEKEVNPKALFLEKRLEGMVSRHPLPEKSPAKNDHHHHHRQNGGGLLRPYHHQNQNQGFFDKSSLQNSRDSLKSGNNNRDGGRFQRLKKFSADSSSSVADSDLDCFLNAIDFNCIDGQELQELLSSY